MPNVLILPIAAATCVATLVGGWFGLALRDRLHLLLGFSAGAVIGVALFDLLPEALALGGGWSPRAMMGVAGVGFALYMVFDRLLDRHDHGERDPRRGWTAAAGFSIHSFLDGLAIGLAFQAGQTVGVAVAVAVLAHDFSDGLNTIAVVLRNGGERRGAWSWLVADAIAPVLGALASLAFTLPAEWLGLVLALFAGFFLYVGTADLLPESHHEHPHALTTVFTLLGAALLYVVAQVAG